jgi:hypothetical protein
LAPNSSLNLISRFVLKKAVKMDDHTTKAKYCHHTLV